MLGVNRLRDLSWIFVILLGIEGNYFVTQREREQIENIPKYPD
jgi:hypothetical protein